MVVSFGGSGVGREAVLKQLLIGVAARDADAERELFGEWLRVRHTTALGNRWNRHQVDEAWSEACNNVAEHLRAGKPRPRDFHAWFHTILVRQITTEALREVRQQQLRVPGQADVVSGYSHDDVDDCDALQYWCDRLTARMSGRERTIFKYALFGVTGKDLAEPLGTSREAVKVSGSRARIKAAAVIATVRIIGLGRGCGQLRAVMAEVDGVLPVPSDKGEVLEKAVAHVNACPQCQKVKGALGPVPRDKWPYWLDKVAHLLGIVGEEPATEKRRDHRDVRPRVRPAAPVFVSVPSGPALHGRRPSVTISTSWRWRHSIPSAALFSLLLALAVAASPTAQYTPTPATQRLTTQDSDTATSRGPSVRTVPRGTRPQTTRHRSLNARVTKSPARGKTGTSNTVVEPSDSISAGPGVPSSASPSSEVDTGQPVGAVEPIETGNITSPVETTAPTWTTTAPNPVVTFPQVH